MIDVGDTGQTRQFVPWRNARVSCCGCLPCTHKLLFPILRPFVVVADSGYGLHDCLTSKSSSDAAPQQLTLNHAGKQKL